MKKQECVIVGAGTYGQVYAEYLATDYEIIGFIDDNSDLKSTSINGYVVLGNLDYLLNNISKSVAVFVPIGNNVVRVKIISELIKNGFTTPNYIHPSVILAPSVKLGKAVYILAGSSIMPFTELTDFVMISMGVNIAHHSVIETGCFFSQGTNIGASILIKKNAFCGVGATIMTGVTRIGENSLIGAGAVIIRDVPDGATVVGNPGKIIKQKEI